MQTTTKQDAIEKTLHLKVAELQVIRRALLALRGRSGRDKQ